MLRRFFPIGLRRNGRRCSRRALFDPATYGCVRFHHRSVQEYLAARRLRVLHETGMSTKALFRLLFAERYGVEVVFPSMRAIAAWLALWIDAAREELIEREPGSPDFTRRSGVARPCGSKCAAASVRFQVRSRRLARPEHPVHRSAQACTPGACDGDTRALGERGRRTMKSANC